MTKLLLALGAVAVGSSLLTLAAVKAMSGRKATNEDVDDLVDDEDLCDDDVAVEKTAENTETPDDTPIEVDEADVEANDTKDSNEEV
jgi:hypothetical protein